MARHHRRAVPKKFACEHFAVRSEYTVEAVERAPFAVHLPWSTTDEAQAYIRNSTVFAMDSLKIPLLLEEGDIDGNVNPFQSQEVYNFGRRLGKNIVYLVYEQENHGVARPESQADYARRQLEWFGHYLKGEPAQPWITEGETYATRQKILKDAAGGASAVQAGNPANGTGRPER